MRRQIDSAAAAAARRTFRDLPIKRHEPDVHDEAWRLAEELGLAKTYDAEFLALARLTTCWLLTADARLHRTGRRLGLTVDPVELTAELS